MTARGIPIGAILVEENGVNIGPFTGLNIGTGLAIRDQGPTLALGLAAEPPAAAQQSVVFKPGTPSSGNTVATWAEVAALIASTGGLIDVYIDSSLANCVISSSVDCRGRTRFIGVQHLNAAAGATWNLEFGAGFFLTDPASFENLTLIGTGADKMVQLTISAFVMELVNAQVLVGTNSVPAISVAGDNSVIVLNNSGFFGAFSATDAYIGVEGTAPSFFLRILQCQGLIFAPDNAFLVGGIGTSLTIQTDGSAYPPAQTALVAGNQTQSLILRTQTGDTADRPTAPGVGEQFFDQSLGKPIWWDGAQWVLADGTPA